MKKEKLYFCDNIDAEYVYPKSFFIYEMKERGISELEIFEAIKDPNKDYFFCLAFMDVVVKEESEHCGKKCILYNPRNGKSGCCKYRRFCYSRGNRLVLKSNGKILKTK